MLRLLTACVGLCLCASAQESALSVYLHTQNLVPPTVLQSLKSETERVLRDLNARTVWHDPSAVRETEGRLVVADLNGACSLDGYRPRTLSKKSALASTAVTNGAVQPFVTVECARVMDLIAPSVVNLSASERDEVLGRSLGRVLAHEIYHVLSGNQKHHDHGIASSSFRAGDLLSRHFDLDESSVAQMQKARLEPPVASEPEADLSFPIGR